MKILNKLFLFTGIVLLTGCSKDPANPEVNPFMSVMNVSPTLATYNIYLNGTRATSGAVPFGGIINYQPFPAGQSTVKITNGGTDAPVLQKDVNLEMNKVYSLFLTGKDQQRELLLIEDQYPEKNTEKAYIRLVNLSPDAPALDLQLSEGQTSLATNKAYKQHSGFTLVAAGTHTFVVREQGTQAVKLTVPNQTLGAGKAYTLIVTGLNTAGDLDKPLGAQLVTNY
ncbi:hypothetical protein C7T94_18295 [Pedobacter yulinensis]|uniref:DUF4397 domain-containing protein n=1 Tax=Pedobacter yulinensis TaxID=2126353 RepID=A0A2T3HHA2_9SPHI|nr:DUF4397 domain-containing protein [Pedobacter yulinensis]PST81819.1 hypothetical protein C7T94_18295 [Pedobacter yulinensis]